MSPAPVSECHCHWLQTGGWIPPNLERGGGRGRWRGRGDNQQQLVENTGAGSTRARNVTYVSFLNTGETFLIEWHYSQFSVSFIEFRYFQEYIYYRRLCPSELRSRHVNCLYGYWTVHEQQTKLNFVSKKSFLFEWKIFSVSSDSFLISRFRD